jgi:hypothetical protein
MGHGSCLYFVRHTEIHAAVRGWHCAIHFQQSVRFVAVCLRDQWRGLPARHHRVDDSRPSRCRRICSGSIGTRLIDRNRYVCDYVVVLLHDTWRRQMEHIHRPNSVESHRRVLVQRRRPSLCLYRIVFGIAAKGRRPASVELTWRFCPRNAVGCPRRYSRHMRSAPRVELYPNSAAPAQPTAGRSSFESFARQEGATRVLVRRRSKGRTRSAVRWIMPALARQAFLNDCAA